MYINNGATTWNLGDTSFRRKKLLNDYKKLLLELMYLNEDFDNSWAKEIQEEYYKRIVKNTNLLKDKDCSANRKDKLGRTYTSALFKIGLCTKNRIISEVGLQFLGKTKFEADELEKRLMIKKDNMIFLRQLLKLCINDSNNKSTAYNPFIFLIKLLNKYEFLTKEEFTMLLHLANSGTKCDEVINNFQNVRNEKMSLSKFLQEYLIKKTNKFSGDKEEFINKYTYDDKLFEDVFINGKTPKSVEKYKEFYDSLIQYNKNNNEENLKKLIKLIKDDAIKKAFSTNKLFDIRSLNKINVLKFNKKYLNSKLINKFGKEFREDFVNIFIISKREDIISEYVDMTFRVFNLTGLISFKNDKVKVGKLYAKEYFKYIDKYLNPIIPNNQDNIFRIKTTNEILGVNKVQEVDKLISQKYGLKPNDDINQFIINKEICDFEKFIKQNFASEKIIDILRAISLRDDDKVFSEVTDQTTVPTIFEYILGIAWYYISDKKINLYESLNLTLDSTYYPLTHAAGGEGDIVINCTEPKEHKLMLEATLMDMNTQKRGELEPVIRHAVNLTVENKGKETYTIFIANELDNNVVNIFRFCDLIKLESSQNRGNFTDSTRIVALTIEEVIKILERKINYNKIYAGMRDEFFIKDLTKVNNNWRDRFTRKIFS